MANSTRDALNPGVCWLAMLLPATAMLTWAAFMPVSAVCITEPSPIAALAAGPLDDRKVPSEI